MAEHRPAEYNIFCLVVGENDPFSTEIRPDATVDALKKAIKREQQPQFDSFAASNLTLFQIDVSALDMDQAYAQIAALDSSTRAMNPVFKLSDYYPATPPEKTIHVLVRVPEIGLRGLKRKASSEANTEVGAKRLCVTTDSLASIRPSTFGREDHYKRLDPEKFAFNRPPILESIPLAILHPIFGQFVEDSQTSEVTEIDHALMRDLRKELSIPHTDENEYCNEFRRILTQYYPNIQLQPARVGGSGFTSHGHLNVGKFMACVCEGKLWKGTGDPEVQATGYMIASIRELFKEGDYADMFPCMIISLFGHYISFSGAVLTDRLHLQVLTTGLPVHSNLHESESATQLARTLGAFRRAVEKLQGHYTELTRKLPSKSLPAVEMDRLLYPYPNSFANSQGGQTKFTYTRRLHNQLLMFVAKAGGINILIKFTRQYSEAAHRFCADNGVAPHLYAVERLSGGWMMVVMDYLNPEAYKHLYPSPPLDDALLREIQQVVEVLHSGGFVHGDIRGPNVMFCPTKVGTGRIMLVDFDWAGPEGDVKYPPDIDPEDRPAGAKAGNIIQKEHDLEMVGLIFQKPSPITSS